MKSRVRNDLFEPGEGLDRGRSRLVEAAWYAVKVVFFLSAWPWPKGWRVCLLRFFGAEIGKNVVIKPRVNIHFPWKLTVGDHTWIGEEVCILNFEPIRLGSNVCISQRAFLCAGNHNYRLINMPYRNRSITVADGAWVGAQVFVAPGVEIGVDAVVTAGSVVVEDLPPAMVCAGNPCEPVRPRWSE